MIIIRNNDKKLIQKFKQSFEYVGDMKTQLCYLETFENEKNVLIYASKKKLTEVHLNLILLKFFAIDFMLKLAKPVCNASMIKRYLRTSI